MTATINTDASFHPVFKVGAFAFWISINGERIIHSGALKKAKCSNEAEMQCIINALTVLYRSKYENIQYIVINTDNKYAIEALKEKKKHRVKLSPESVKLFDKLMVKMKKKYGVRPNKLRKHPFISWRYVKAHSEGEDARSWVNNRCDVMAKEALWKMINLKK